MANILVPLLVCIIGAVVHLTTAKTSQLGLYAFATGLFWTLSVTVGTHFKLG